jgi:hypothetical protein
LLKKSNTPVKQAYYSIDARDIQPKKLNFDDSPPDTHAKSPKKPQKRRQSRGLEISCCEACNALRDAFFRAK